MAKKKRDLELVKCYLLLGVVGTLEFEARGFWVQGHAGLPSETLSQKHKTSLSVVVSIFTPCTWEVEAGDVCAFGARQGYILRSHLKQSIGLERWFSQAYHTYRSTGVWDQLGMVACTCHPRAGEIEMGGPQGLASQSA